MNTSTIKFFMLIIIGFVPFFVFGQAPAFPGAEGAGRYVQGGRGGKVIHVTNLNDHGMGSFREAVKGSDNKIVVFDVGGVIALDNDITIGDNTTIAGQTAPYPGITFRYRTIRPGSNNVIRFIRVRRGQEKDINEGEHVDGRFVGGDISLLPSYINHGATYFDLNGNPISQPLQYFGEQGMNAMRVRLFVNPENASDTHKGEGVPLLRYMG